MRRKLIVYCEACGSDRPGGDDFVIFHCLAFCSPDCRAEYRTADEQRASRGPATRRPDTPGYRPLDIALRLHDHRGTRQGLPEPRVPRVKVDRERCQGHARCAALAPELFSLDALGNAQEIGDGTVPPALVEKAWLAKANCPELAIAVEEDG